MPRLLAAAHVRKREEFERIYQQGVRVSGRHMQLFVRANEFAFARLGVAATRKLGSAVVRNRAKRLARELFRHHKPAGGYDVVVIPRREMIDAPYQTLEAEFRELLARRGRPSGGSRRPPRAPSAQGV